MIDLKQIKNKPKRIRKPFSSHRVIIKTISDGMLAPSPSKALAYIVNNYKDTPIVVNKQRARHIIITICCSDSQYKLMKLYFVKDMGHDFIWKDREEN